MRVILNVICAVIFSTTNTEIVSSSLKSAMNFTELVTREGSEYTAERHTARTVDGYLLFVHRLRRADVKPRKAAPVLLMHGIICSSEDFIRMGKNRSLGYLLANEGFDVWIGNFRGNMYTLHVKMNMTNLNFWNFSYHEHGIYDLPAIFDMMESVTGTERLHYVGYSMGTTSYFVLASARPDVAARVASFTALAPVAALNPKLKNIIHLMNNVDLPRTLLPLGLSTFGYSTITKRLMQTFCSTTIGDRDVCLKALSLIIGEDGAQMDYLMQPVIVAKLQPVSLKVFNHFLQLGATDTFQEYNYGAAENMVKYGQSTPPKYNLNASKAPTAIFWGKNDYLASPEVVSRLISTLRNNSPVVHNESIAYELFNHVDFLWAKNIDTLLNNNVVKMIIKFSEKYA